MHHQELLKSSTPPYSNGLEQIYAFETVDARSVRKMASPLRDTSHASEEAENTTPRFKKTNTPTQLTFDLGSDYSFGLPHIALREPIEALKLSSATNRVLHSLGKKNISDVYQLVYKHSKNSGVHPGILEELRSKIEYRLGPIDPTELQNRICWKSVLRYSFQELSPKFRAFLAIRYGFLPLVEIPMQDLRDAERMMSKNDQKLISNTLDEARYSCSKNILLILEDIYRAYIKRWLQFHEGFETHDQITEALLTISIDHQDLVSNSLICFEELLGLSFLFQHWMVHAIENIWGIDPLVSKDIVQIHELSLELTQDNSIPIHLESLISLILRNWPSLWEAPSQPFIRKALISRYFSV